MNAETEGLQRDLTEIPRHKRWNGPLVMPAKHRCVPGNRVCQTCGRSWKGKCSCLYYKRTTNWIDVIQNEYMLKQWDRRLVAYGMAQRPDLVLAATTCKPPDDKRNLTQADKNELQAIADKAKEYAKGDAAARVGTSLHKLTQFIDEGQTLGYVPEDWTGDLRAYEEMVKREHIEYHDIEVFRVHDEFKVGGTADRFGYVRSRSDRYRVLDVKTGDLWGEGLGQAMQLAMYARMVKYDIATDTRVPDYAEVDLNVGYIIHMVERSGQCELIPIDIAKGWRACLTAKLVWEARDEKGFFIKTEGAEREASRRRVSRPAPGYAEMAVRAGTVRELKLLWKNAKDQGELTDSLRLALTERAEELKAAG